MQRQISAGQPQSDYLLDYAAASVLMPAKPWPDACSAISNADSGVAKLAPVLEVLSGVPAALQPLLQHAWRTLQSGTDAASAPLFEAPLQGIVGDALISRMASTSQQAPWQAMQAPQSQQAGSSALANVAAPGASVQPESSSASNTHANSKRTSKRNRKRHGKHSARIDTSQLN